MPQSRKNPGPRLDPRRPLVLSAVDLDRSPGSVRTQTLTVPAPAHVHAGLAGVPEGAEIALRVQMEAVSEGVLVTATAHAPVTGECARCLEPVHQQVDVSFQELFVYAAADGAEADGADAGDGYPLHGDLFDLEPALHDALVLALPLAPLCREDCPGLCVECGVQLAAAGPDHAHGPVVDPRWAGLQQVAARLGDPEAGAVHQKGNGHRESAPDGTAGLGD
jgi:uncharacterized protein